MGLIKYGHLTTWLRANMRILVVMLLVAIAGVAVAPLRIAARTQELSGPTFSTAILLPCLGATVAMYLSLPVQPLLERLSPRPMHLWRTAQGLAAGAIGMLLVTPGALAAHGDSSRIMQNTGVFTAAAFVVGRLVHPILGVVLPWLWALAALLFGLNSGDLGEPQWAWWSWIVGAQPQVWVGVAALVFGALGCMRLPRSNIGTAE